MTNGSTPLTHPAPENGARPTTLDSSAGYITNINTYKVAPEPAEALLDLPIRAADETVRYVPGFVSANFHINLDKNFEVVNYAPVAESVRHRLARPMTWSRYARSTQLACPDSCRLL